MVPSSMLNVCAAAITRPSWESMLKYVLVFGVIIGLCAASLMAYFEAGSIVSSAVVATVRVIPPSGRCETGKSDSKEATTRLDLKAVYDKVDNRFKRNQREAQQKSLLSQSASTTVSSTTCTNATQSSKSSGEANGAGNGNSSLRNRKNKKGNAESNTASLSTKLTDKSNQPQQVQPSGKGSTTNTPLEETSRINNGNGNVKKDKENAYSGGVNPTPTSAKKKKNGGQNNNSKKHQQQSNSNLPGVRLPAAKSPKLEEETSSTTTESSNPDDLSWSTPKEKERKPSGKFTPVPTGSDTKGNQKLAKKDRGSTTDSYAAKSNMSGNGKSPTGNDACDDKEGGFEEYRKKSGNKKRDRNENCSSPKGSDGNNKSETQPCMWDNPKQSGEGLSELSAQTEAFVHQKQRKRNSSDGHKVVGDCSAKNLVTSCNSMNGSLSNISEPVNHGTLNGGISASQCQYYNYPSAVAAAANGSNGLVNRSRRPGVIGQPRLLPSGNANTMPRIPNLMQSQAANPLAMMDGMSGPPRMHAPPVRTLSSPGCSSWGSDILPNNGCDIWNRKSTMDSNYNGNFRNSPNATTSNISPRPSDVSRFSNSGANFGVPDPYIPSGQAGYSSSSSCLNSSNASSNAIMATTTLRDVVNCNQSGLRYGSTQISSSGASGSTMSDSAYMNNSLANDVISNLWQYSGTSATGFDSNLQAGKQSRQLPLQATSQVGFNDLPTQKQKIQQNPQGQMALSTTGQHGYLQRMRSDPSSRQDYGANGNTSFCNLMYGYINMIEYLAT